MSETHLAVSASAHGEVRVLGDNKRRFAISQVLWTLDELQELRKAAHRAGVSDKELRYEIRQHVRWTKRLEWVQPLLGDEFVIERQQYV